MKKANADNIPRVTSPTEIATAIFLAGLAAGCGAIGCVAVVLVDSPAAVAGGGGDCG